jgi:fatty-acyl-CoA synthase
LWCAGWGSDLGRCGRRRNRCDLDYGGADVEDALALLGHPLHRDLGGRRERRRKQREQRIEERPRGRLDELGESYPAGCTQGARYGRRSRRFASSSPTTTPFAWSHVSDRPITTLADVRRLEEATLAERVPVQSTHELLANTAAEYGDRPAITFIHDPADPDDTTRLSYDQLLGRCRALANALHRAGLQHDEVVSILMPPSAEYHVGLWGGSFAGIVQPLNPLLNEDKLAALMNAARSRVLIAWGADDDAPYWTRAEQLARIVPTLSLVLRAGPAGLGGDNGGAESTRVLDLESALAAEPQEGLTCRREIAGSDIAASSRSNQAIACSVEMISSSPWLQPSRTR